MRKIILAGVLAVASFFGLAVSVGATTLPTNSNIIDPASLKSVLAAQIEKQKQKILAGLCAQLTTLKQKFPALTLPAYCIPTPPPPPPAPTLDFSATPETILQGNSATLNWGSSNANTCTASGGWSGSEPLFGSLEVFPTATTTYMLLCEGDGGSIQKDATVNVIIPPPVQTIGHVVINEVYPAPIAPHGSGSDNEWVELYNASNDAVDLSGWGIKDNSAEDILPTIDPIQPGGFLIITASSTTAGLWPSIPDKTPIIVLKNDIGNGLANAGDRVIIENSASTTIDAMSYGTDVGVFSHWATTTIGGVSLYRTQLASDTDTAADWATTSAPTPGSF